MRFLFLALLFALPAPLAAQAQGSWGLAVTQGAARGYVADGVCSDCHSDVAREFTGHAMGNSFYRASAARAIEDFSTGYYHAPSDRHYRITLRGDDYWFRRHRLADDGAEIDVFEARIDWIVGSGNHSRVYLIRSAGGVVTQLPLAWYTQSQSWAMAPGFEFPDHFELQRVVERRCMSCHNGYPDLPAGADLVGMPALFPAELPEGIGCQRCHGPGAEHAALALEGEISGGVSGAALRAAILNPGDFTRAQQRDLCASCHYQPTAAMNAPLRLGVGAMQFRPGDRLDAHVAHIDITDAHRAPLERFDINHHAYRLEQSACFTQTQGALGCLSCHDPHGKAPPAERVRAVRGVCLECHAPAALAEQHPALEMGTADCASCHMPKRRTQDVIEVTMTDHLIQRPPPGDPTAPIAKLPAQVTAVRLVSPAPDLRPGEGVIYQTLAILEHTGNRDVAATEALAEVMARHDPPYFEPWLRLARAYFSQSKPGPALGALRKAMQLAPANHPGPLGLGALLRAQQGHPDVALEMLRQSLDLAPGIPEQHLNMAVIHRSLGEHDAALAEARRALELQFTLWSAWRLIGETMVDLGQTEAAIEAFEAALAIEPEAARVRPALIALLEAAGRDVEAARHASVLGRVAQP